MAFTIQPLFEPVRLTAAAAIYYNATARTQVQKLVVSNPDPTVSYSATIYWVPAGGTAGAGNAIETTRIVQPLEAWIVSSFLGHTLGIGDTIQALASVAVKLNFFGSGMLMS